MNALNTEITSAPSSVESIVNGGSRLPKARLALAGFALGAAALGVSAGSAGAVVGVVEDPFCKTVEVQAILQESTTTTAAQAKDLTEQPATEQPAAQEVKQQTAEASAMLVAAPGDVVTVTIYDADGDIVISGTSTDADLTNYETALKMSDSLPDCVIAATPIVAPGVAALMLGIAAPVAAVARRRSRSKA